MIPKIIHQIFLSGAPPLSAMPSLWKTYSNQFKTMYSNWSVVFWNGAKADGFVRAQYPDWTALMEHAPVAALRTDILRYMLLYNFGGWYFDMDCEPVRPVDELCGHSVILPLEEGTTIDDADARIGNAVLASEPGHWFWKKALAAIWKNRVAIARLSSAEREQVIDLTGPRFLHRVFCELSTEEQALFTLPAQNYFHAPVPHPMTRADAARIKKNPEIYALHHSHSTWRTTNKKDTQAAFRRRMVARNPALNALSAFWNKHIKPKKD